MRTKLAALAALALGLTFAAGCHSYHRHHYEHREYHRWDDRGWDRDDDWGDHRDHGDRWDRGWDNRGRQGPPIRIR